MLPRDTARLEHILEYCESIEAAAARFGNDRDSFCEEQLNKDI